MKETQLNYFGPPVAWSLESQHTLPERESLSQKVRWRRRWTLHRQCLESAGAGAYSGWVQQCFTTILLVLMVVMVVGYGGYSENHGQW